MQWPRQIYRSAISEAVNTINTVVTSVQNLKFEDGLPAADSKVTAAFDSATKKIEQCYNEYGVRLSCSTFFYALI